MARGDYTLVDPVPVTPGGMTIYQRSSGTGFSLVLEARPGGTGTAVDPSTFNSNPGGLPGLLIEVSRPLGDATTAVCDDMSPTLGGVPAVNPPDFSSTQSNAINDLACRFKDGRGLYSGRTKQQDACTTFEDGGFRFVATGSTIQYCGLFAEQKVSFPTGDTVVTARVRDLIGNVSATAQIIVRVTPPR